jgi:hypothetical protein
VQGTPPHQGDSADNVGLHEVRATFSSAEAMQKAIDQLEMHGFDRADLSLPEPDPAPAHATPEAGAKPADTEQDARQARTLHTSTGATVAALAAAGAVAATGGAALPAVAAAVAAGGVAGGAIYGLSSAANRSEQADRDMRAAGGTLVLTARAPTLEKRERAEAIMREAGGTDIQAS